MTDIAAIRITALGTDTALYMGMTEKATLAADTMADRGTEARTAAGTAAADRTVAAIPEEAETAVAEAMAEEEVMAAGAAETELRASLFEDVVY